MLIRTKQLPLATLLALTLVVTAHARQDPLETIRIDTNLVVLRVAVNDKQGRAIQNLKQGAFKVYEEGVEQQVSFFSSEESPVSWGLVLDRSGSRMGMMNDVYEAALHVIDEGTSRDETFIVTFNRRHEMISDFTSDRHRLENSVLGLRADGETALFDAVDFALDRLKGAKYRKKVLVVITDGQDNASQFKFRELIERAEEEEAVIYAVGMFGSMGGLSSLMGGDRDASAELKKLAQVTGASAHFPSDVDQCRDVTDVMSRDYATVDGHSNLQTFVEEHLVRTGRRCFVVIFDGHAEGIITPNEVSNVERSRWPYTTVADVMRPLDQVRTVAPGAPVTEVLT